MAQRYQSTLTGDGGFIYQEDVFLFMNIRMRELQCTNFVSKYETEDIPKFDDVVCEFQSPTQERIFAIQIKYSQGYQREVSHNDLFLEKPRSKWCLKAILGIMHEEHETGYFMFQKTKKSLKAPMKFILLTNQKFADRVLSLMEEESDPEIREIFLELGDRQPQPQIHKFTDRFSTAFERILPYRNFNELFEFIKENFIVISNFLDMEQLKNFNSERIKNCLKSRNHELIPDVVRNNVKSHIKCDEERSRSPLTKNDFEIIMQSSMITIDFPFISETFLQEIKLNFAFKIDILSDIVQRIRQNENTLHCLDDLEINAMKLLQAVRQNGEKVFIVRWNSLTDTLKKALLYWNGHKIIILLNADDPTDNYRVNQNAIFMKKTKRTGENVVRFSMSDLTEDSRQEFLLRNITFQLAEARILKCFEIRTEESEKILHKIFSRLVRENSLELSVGIPNDKIRDIIYINRLFFRDGNQNENLGGILLPEESLLDDFRLCIVKADAGMGKSVTLQKMAIDFKRNNPHYWVEFIELGKKSKPFLDKKNSGRSEFMDTDDAKDFLFNFLLNYVNNSELSLDLAKYYLLDNPLMFLIFDGFDEIMPTYEDVVLDLVKKLSLLNIKIFISGRMHCDQVLRELEGFEVVVLDSYNDHQMEEYLMRFFQNSESSQDLLRLFKKSYLQENGDMKNILQTPLFLRMTSQIFLDEYRKSGSIEAFNPQLELLDEASIYEKTFEQSFDRFYEKLGTDASNNFAKKCKEKEMTRVREIHMILAFKELGFDDYEHPYQKIGESKNEPEILGRGFVGRMDDGSFYFIHRSFAEYFCAVEFERLLGISINTEQERRIKSYVRNPDLQLSKFVKQIHAKRRRSLDDIL